MGGAALAAALACGGGGSPGALGPAATVEGPATPPDVELGEDRADAEDTGVEGSGSAVDRRTVFSYAPSGRRVSSMDEGQGRALADDGYWTFVVEPGRWRASDAGRPMRLVRTDNDRPDPRVVDRLTEEVVRRSKSAILLARHDAARDDYARVLARARSQGLPDLVAAIPMVMSRYRAEHQGPDCGLGWWGLLPDDVALAAHAGGLPVAVRDCRLAGHARSSPTYTPAVPGPSGAGDASPPYLDPAMRSDDPARCRIAPEGGCAVDDRRDRDKGTAVAFHRLSVAWEDRDFAASGAAVPLLLMAYFDGYDRPRGAHGQGRGIRSSYLAYRRARAGADDAGFFEAAVRCAGAPSGPGCADAPSAASVDFVFEVLASHLLATCVYGRSVDGEHAVFLPYERIAAAHCGLYGTRAVSRTEHPGGPSSPPGAPP